MRDDDAADGRRMVRGGSDPALGGRLCEGRPCQRAGDWSRDGRRTGYLSGERACFAARLASFAAGAGVVPVAADDLGNVWVGTGLVGEPGSHRR